MKGLCVMRLAETRGRCRLCDKTDTELCTCQGVNDDAVRMVTLSQLWGSGALGRSANPAIRAVTSSKELHAIGRLRYRLFVERDGESSAYANHGEGWLLEPVDAASLNLWAGPKRRCFAAIRLTQGADAISDPQLAATLRHSALPQADYSSCLVLSRLAIRREARAQAFAPALARHAYRVGLEVGASTALLASRLADAASFAHLGFKPSGAAWSEPGVGELRCLTLALRDRANLETGRSTLLAELDAFEAAGPAGTSEVSILDLNGDP